MWRRHSTCTRSACSRFALSHAVQHIENIFTVPSVDVFTKPSTSEPSVLQAYIRAGTALEHYISLVVARATIAAEGNIGEFILVGYPRPLPRTDQFQSQMHRLSSELDVISKSSSADVATLLEGRVQALELRLRLGLHSGRMHVTRNEANVCSAQCVCSRRPARPGAAHRRRGHGSVSVHCADVVVGDPSLAF